MYVCVCVCLNAVFAGYALAVAPVLWNSLSPKEKENVEAWLGNSINEKKCAPSHCRRASCAYHLLGSAVIQYAQY